MRITVELPGNITRHSDPGREALEVLAMEGYRSGSLSRSQASRLLGINRSEFEGLLKKRQGYRHDYSFEHLKRDIEDLDMLRVLA